MISDGLTKKERKELRKIEQRDEYSREQRNAMFKKWGIGLVLVSLLGGGLWWLVSVSSKPLPGIAVEDLGREHIKRDEWEKNTYNSNPPTSGSHDAEWIRAGIYDEPQGEGYLVHSLEHGYVIISYNCEKKVSKGLEVPHSEISGQAKVSKGNKSLFSLITNYKLPITSVYAHDDEGDADGDDATGSADLKDATKSAEMTGEAWKSKECTELKKQLKEFAESQRLWKLIVVPRPELDTRLALTAWGRVEKFDPSTSSGLNQSDKDRMAKFIDAFRDKGPEKTEE